MRVNDILKEELSEICLPEEEQKKIKEKVSEAILKLKNVGLNPKIGGSLAKGTIIKKDTQDIDLFIVFEDEDKLKEIENKLKKTSLKFSKLHGSRDYFQITENSFIIELIPVVGIKKPEEAKNVTDLSLMHVDYVVKKIQKNKKLADEIKLAKAFCFSQNCYGAESYIRGFSGYALELLVIHFGSFVNFLKKIEKERTIDIERLYKDKKKIKEELNESKILSPIILIDPTYKTRNACSSLSNETFTKFLTIAKKFIKKPSAGFFEREILDVEKIEKQAKNKKAKFLQIKFYTNKQAGDIAATKMKKFFDFIISELEKKEQKILFKAFSYEDSQDALGYLTIKEKKEIEVKGPPIKMKEAVKQFKLYNKKITIKKGFAYSKKQFSLEEMFNQIKKFEDEMSVRFEILDN